MVYGPNLDFMYWVMDRTKTDTGRLIPMRTFIALLWNRLIYLMAENNILHFKIKQTNK
jgi:uncharacterized membrane protein